MRGRAQHWFRSIPIDDPIDRHLAVITRMMLIGLGMTVILSSLLYLLSLPLGWKSYRDHERAAATRP